MKKIVSLWLVITLLFTCVVPVFSEAETDAMSKVLASVKERISDTDRYDEFESSYWESAYSKIYEFSWSMKNTRDYLNVSVTESGIITNFHKYNESYYSSSGEATINKITADEAIKTAQQFVNELNPEIAGTLVVEKQSEIESLYGDTIRFKVCRYENGYKVLDDSGNLTLSADGKNLMNFYTNYTEGVEFKAPEKVISFEDAADSFSTKLGMKMQYMTERDYETNTKKIYVAYVPEQKDNTYINAVTGEEVTLISGGYNMYFAETEEAVAEDLALSGGGSNYKFSEAEQKNIDEIDNLLSKEAVIKLVTENKLLNIPKTDIMVSLNKQSYSEKYYYSISANAENIYCSVRVDAQNGDILGYNYNDYTETEDKKTKLSEKERAELETAAIEALSGEKFSEYKKENDYSYTRYVNGIAYIDDTISASVDAYTGELIRFSISYTDDVEFPSLDGTISAYDAGISLAEQAEYSPCYIMSGKSEKSKKADISTLVYSFGGYTLKIDAFSGKLLGYDSNEYKKEKVAEYTDISGHYAEDIIKELARFGVSFESEKFNPDAPILQKDYIALLTSVFLGYDAVPLVEKAVEGVYSNALSSGIIKEEENSPNSEITRNDAVKFFVRAIGAEKYASLKGIYSSPFKDVTENIGYTALLYGMGIIKGDENKNFNGDGKITRADSMIMIYNYLSK